MPDYSFFLSYSSKDRIQTDRESTTTNPKDLVRTFFDDLDQQMKLLGYADGGFFDKKGLEADWRQDMRLALASSRILVPLYSPLYFQNAYCGKEWEVFNQRFHENKRLVYPDVGNPTVILPVCWRAPVVLPADVSRYQIQYEGFVQGYDADHGLEYLMSRERYRDAYQDFLFTFSRKLLALAQEQGDAKVRDLPGFDDLNPPFPGINKPGLKYVRYVFVAGLKNEMVTLRETRECYANSLNRKDWRPCYPDLTRPVEKIATGPAKAASKTYEFVEHSPQLMTRLREARRLNNIVVLVVDPWSVKLPNMRQFLDDFDSEEFPNAGVLVNWNAKDPETTAQTAKLQEMMQDHFKGRRARREYYKDPVSTPEGIEQAVAEAFGAIRARLIEMGKIRSVEGDPGAAPVIGN